MDEFAALYRTYGPDVFRFALYLSHDRHDAEDITSETFVRAWNASERIRLETVKGYLLAIARNLYLERVRMRRREVPLEESVPAPGKDPLSRALDSAQIEAVRRGIEALPEIDRSALLLRALEGLPYSEIARVLGISLASAKVKVHRARRALLREG